MSGWRLPRGAPADERGYALVAAVVAIMLFAMIALALVARTRAGLETAAGEIARARAAAAADAGFAIALHGLVQRDEASLAALDGRARQIGFHEAAITIHLIDERGKVPLNQIEPPTLERLLRSAGLDGGDLEVARDSLLDWLDNDDDPRPDGAESAWYARQGITPRNGPLSSIDELARVRGFSPEVIARLRPLVTTEPDALPFAPDHAEPAAIAAMQQDDADATAQIDRAREQAGQRTAIAFTDPHMALKRPITISVDARVPGGGHVHREGVVMIFDDEARPYEIRNLR